MTSLPTPPASEDGLRQAIQKGDISLLESMLSTIKEEHERKKITSVLEDAMLQHWHPGQYDEDQLISIVEIIRVFRKNHFPIDLSVISDPSFSAIMKQLFFLKPSDANWILENIKTLSPKLKLFKVHHLEFTKTEISHFDVEESTALYHFLSRMSLSSPTWNPYGQYYETLIDNYVHANSEYAIPLILQQAMELETLLQNILRHDSVCCLEEFLRYIENPDAYLKEHSIAAEENLLEPWHPTTDDLLKQAIAERALKSIITLLNHFYISPTDLEPFIQQAADNSDLSLVLALCQNDFQKAAQYLFHDAFFLRQDTKDPKEIASQESLRYDALIAMLRFTSIEVVDKTVQAYEGSTDNKDVLLKSYLKAKEEFFNYAPTFSRHTNLKTFTAFKNLYNRDLSEDLIGKAKNDMQYGKERSALVTHLVNFLESEIKTPGSNTFVPTRLPELRELPPSSKGSRTFAALLDKIADYHAQKNMDKPFYSLNKKTKKSGTPIEGQYQWAKPLVSAVFHHSQSQHIRKYPDKRFLDSGIAYSLLYKNSIINNINYDADWKQGNITSTYMTWEHGRLPLKDTIGDIENLLDKMKVAFSQEPGPGATEAERIKYQAQHTEELIQFYKDAAQLVWLIGNTQPLKRGSGSVAELVLNAIFKFHGLQPPILKPEFPQLDVLDITFPLDDYIKLFPYFFEPSSLAEAVRKPSLSHLSLSAEEQIKAYYNEINGVESLNTFIERKALSPENINTAPSLESKILEEPYVALQFTSKNPLGSLAPELELKAGASQASEASAEASMPSSEKRSSSPPSR